MASHVKNVLSDWASKLLYFNGLPRPKRMGKARLTIATFHRVQPNVQREPYPMPGLAVTPEELACFIGFLTFSYPNGDDDARTIAAVQQAGLSSAITTHKGNDNLATPYNLSRFDIQADHAREASGTFSPGRIAWRMSGLHSGPT